MNQNRTVHVSGGMLEVAIQMDVKSVEASPGSGKKLESTAGEGSSK